MDPHDDVLLARLGQTIAGRWTLHSLIGTGGMAAVYAATNPEGQSAALKLLYPEMAMRKEIRERFLREAAVMARILHPGMVTIYEQGQSGDLAYLAMELLHGETVADRVRRIGRLEPGEVLNILDQVLDVLNLAHSMGIVHRDLKPENLFLTQGGRLKVLDFGLARLLDAGTDSFRTRTGAALGTLPYMAPEQALGRRDEVDARTDIFAVGATAYRLLSGRRIHEAPSDAELLMSMASEPAKPLLTVAPLLRPDVGSVVDRSLAFAKTSRYPDAATMQRDVRALQNGQPPTYALACREHDEAATNVDRMAPRDAATAPLPHSTRPLHAAMPKSLAVAEDVPHEVGPTALDAGTATTEPHAALPASPRVLPATVAMPASQRAAATVPDPTALPGLPDVTGAVVAGATIPNAPMSDAVLERQRRQTVRVGLLLLFGMLGAATAAGWYFVGQSHKAPARPNTTIPVPALPSQGADGDQHLRDARMRHPAHVLIPEDPLAPQRGDTLPIGRHPKHAGVTKPAAPVATSTATNPALSVATSTTANPTAPVAASATTSAAGPTSAHLISPLPVQSAASSSAASSSAASSAAASSAAATTSPAPSAVPKPKRRGKRTR